MRAKHFDIKELVSPKFYASAGDAGWAYISPTLIEMIDRLREVFGPVIVNDWAWGGSFRYRGLRAEIDIPALKRQKIYRIGSLHNFGKAVDCHFRNVTVDQAREYIISHQGEFPHIRGIEIAPWLHIDVRNSDRMVIFRA